jgi:hypothetical protein
MYNIYRLPSSGFTNSRVSPVKTGWSTDFDHLYVDWRKPGEKGSLTYRVGRRDKAHQRSL